MTTLPEGSTTQQAANIPLEDLLATSSQFAVGPLRVDLIGANTATAYYRHRGADATVASLDAVITAALDVDATITFAVEGVDVGVMTIPALGSAPGEAVQLVPSPGVTLTDGDRLRLTVGGGDTAASFADVSIALERVIEIDVP